MVHGTCQENDFQLQLFNVLILLLHSSRFCKNCWHHFVTPFAIASLFYAILHSCKEKHSHPLTSDIDGGCLSLLTNNTRQQHKNHICNACTYLLHVMVSTANSKLKSRAKKVTGGGRNKQV